MAWRWSVVQTTGSRPKPRGTYASALFDGSFYVLGGWDGKKAYSDGYALDVDIMRWRSLYIGRVKADDAPRSAPPPTIDDRMHFGHTAADGIIYVHGGMFPENLAIVRDNMFAFDTRTSMLRELRLSGDGPGPISRQAMAVANGYIWVIAGWDGKQMLDGTFRLKIANWEAGEVGKWERIKTEGFTPWRRSHMCVVAEPRAHHVMLFGGGDSNLDFDDLYALDTNR